MMYICEMQNTSKRDTCDQRAPQVAVVEAELVRQFAVQTVIEQDELGTAAANDTKKVGKNERQARKR
jgi:hypothetical protein